IAINHCWMALHHKAVNESDKIMALVIGITGIGYSSARGGRVTIPGGPSQQAPPLSSRTDQVLRCPVHRDSVDGAERLAFPTLAGRSRERDELGVRVRLDHVHRLCAGLHERLPDFDPAAGPQAAVPNLRILSRREHPGRGL